MELGDFKKAMKGVFIVHMTPFNKDGNLDLEGMRGNIRWLLERTAGKDFVYVPEGSNGECFAQSEDEWKSVAKMVVEEVNGKHPVIIGAGQPSTRETIKRCQYAESVGADGVMVVLPYYMISQEEGLYQHYKQVAESINIGVVIYNNPFVNGSWVRPPLMARLAKIPNMVAVKENVSSVISFVLMQRAVGEDMVVLCGRGEEIFPFRVPFGCPGFISYLANFAPDVAYSMYEAAVAKDFDKVNEVSLFISPFFKDAEVIRCMVPPVSSFTAKVTAKHGPGAGITGGGGSMQFSWVKSAMDMIGLRGGEVRLPIIGINEEEKAELKGILKSMKILG